MTPMNFMNQTGNMTPPDRMDGSGMHEVGNTTPPEPRGETAGNTTAPAMGPGFGQGDRNQTQTSGDQVVPMQTQQQSKDDVIASLISQLQALLSGKK